MSARDELLLVHATGPRGDQAATHSHAHHVRIDHGRAVRGARQSAHLPWSRRGGRHPPTQPDGAAYRRLGRLPDRRGQPVRQRIGTAIVNRQRIDLIVPSLEHDVDVMDIPFEPDGGRLGRVSDDDRLVVPSGPTH